jgi:hypothetical protein
MGKIKIIKSKLLTGIFLLGLFSFVMGYIGMALIKQFLNFYKTFFWRLKRDINKKENSILY